MSSFTQHQLSNGLTVLLKEVHHVPVASWWVAYRVGSRNEPTGKTGISHWVEHMMFKGTPRYPAGVLDREIDRLGGQWNAMTTTDTTMYYETLPADKIDLALEIEADRMVNALFDPEETESERTVIISERQGDENSPVFWLREQMRAAAFRVHGYHHSIIGDMIDLHTMTRDDLFAHYRQHYAPQNAVAVGVGAFDTDEMLAKIEAYYSNIPAVDAPQLFMRPEPEQVGERRITVERPGHTAFFMVAYHVPPATHDDWFVLELLDSVLTGPGGGIDNKTSRLYQTLVKTEIAAGIGGGLQETIDPYLYSIVITLRDGRTHAEVETVLFEQIDRLIKEGITQAELDRAKKQACASFAYSVESVTNQAYWLAQSAILDDFSWNDRYVERLERVTLEDIQCVAQQYLVPRNRIVGNLIPTGMDDLEMVEDADYD